MTVISSEENVLAVVKGRDGKSIMPVLSNITSIKSIKEVSMDLFSAYAKVIRELIPEAQITVDRFHVIRLLNKLLWSINKKSYKILDETLRKKYSSIRYILSRSYAELLKDEKRLLKEYFKINTKIKEIYIMVQEFRNILFNYKGADKSIVEARLFQWIYKTEGKMKTFVRTLGIWFDQIVNACIYRNSNARQEGINNKIKLVKRRGFGYRNCENFKYRILGECNS